jgi:2'-5' RNA ligase
VYAADMRLFAGLPLPDVATERLTRLRLRLAAPGDGLRWSTPEQWHITLRFFGEVGIEAAAALSQASRQLRSPVPRVCMSELGLFAAKGILFAGIGSSIDLEGLQAEVEQVAAQAGLLPESRPFRPHITLARSRNRAGLTRLQRLGQPTLPAFGSEICWQAEEVLLYESALTRQGAEYRVIERVTLPGR